MGREDVAAYGVDVVYTRFMSLPQTTQNLCICSVLYVLYYISSLCSGGFDVCDCRHVLVQCVLGTRH